MSVARTSALIIALTLLVVGPAVAAGPAAQKDTRPTLALLSVTSGGGFPTDQLGSIEGVLLTALESTGRFRVIGKTDVATLLDVESKKQAVGCSDDTTGCMTMIAGALGAEYVASAIVGRVGTVTVLTFKIIDVRKVVVLLHASQRVQTDAQLLGACDDVAAQVVEAVFHTGPPAASAQEPARSVVAAAPAEAPASPPPAPAPRPNLFDGAPPWVFHGTGAFAGDHGRVFYGVGLASNIRSASLRRGTAAANARAELTRLVETFAHSVFKTYAAASPAGADNTETKTLADGSRSSISQLIASAPVLDRWIAQDNSTELALVGLDFNAVRDSIVRAGGLSERMRDVVNAQSETAFDELSGGR
jgi:hypothetical protein